MSFNPTHDDLTRRPSRRERLNHFCRTWPGAMLLVALMGLASWAATNGYTVYQQQTLEVGGIAKTSSPTFSDGDYVPLQQDLNGNLRVTISGAGNTGTGAGQVQGTAAAAAAKAGNPVMIGGQDGTNAETLLTDTSGRPVIVGAAAAGAAISGNPVLAGGSDGTNARALKVDTSGNQIVVGAAATGGTLAGNPVRIGGSDGSLARDIATDTSGRLIHVGAAATGAAVAGSPVYIGGSDGTNVEPVAMDTSGRVRVIGGAAQGATIAGNPVLIGGTFTTAPATITTGQAATLQTDNVQNLLTKVNVALPAGAAIIGKVTTDQTTPGTTDLVSMSIVAGTAGAALGQTSDAAAGDATGSIEGHTRFIAKSLTPGQAAMAASVPVTMASNQTAITVAGGAAAGAAVAGNPNLIAAIDAAGNAETIVTDVNGLLMVGGPVKNGWAITNAAAVNAVATATKAAGAAGVKHCLTGFEFSAWQDNTGTVSAATGYTFVVRDGATGAGTIIWSETLSFPVATNGTSIARQYTFPTPLIGTAATAMCIEVSSSALLHTGATVNGQGYDTK